MLVQHSVFMEQKRMRRTNTNPIGVKGSNGSYTVDKTSKEYDMVSIGDGTTVGKGMNLKLNGLAAGIYWLVETDVPDGYNGITAPIKITIQKSATENVGEWTITKDNTVDPDPDKIIDVENSTGTILPGTGGMGTILFTGCRCCACPCCCGKLCNQQKKTCLIVFDEVEDERTAFGSLLMLFIIT